MVPANRIKFQFKLWSQTANATLSEMWDVIWSWWQFSFLLWTKWKFLFFSVQSKGKRSLIRSYTQRNLFEILLNHTEIQLYLPIFDGFGMVNTTIFRVDLIRFLKDSSVWIAFNLKGSVNIFLWVYKRNQHCEKFLEIHTQRNQSWILLIHTKFEL